MDLPYVQEVLNRFSYFCNSGGWTARGLGCKVVAVINDFWTLQEDGGGCWQPFLLVQLVCCVRV